MTASELARRELYARLEEVLGREHAETLMTHLPAHDAEGLATKADVAATRADIAEVRADLQHLESRFDVLESRFDRMEERFERMEERFERMDERFYGLQETMRDQLRTYTVTTIGAMTALTGIFAGVVAVLR
ncbi:MAG: hypothetical protein WD895_07845 [Acidimicrobiia bacterium]